MVGGSEVFSLDSSMLKEKDLASQLQIKIWEKLSRFNYMKFNECREYIWTLGFKNYKDWKRYLNSKDRRMDVPSHPYRQYEHKGWLSWPDFLGTKPGWNGE